MNVKGHGILHLFASVSAGLASILGARMLALTRHATQRYRTAFVAAFILGGALNLYCLSEHPPDAVLVIMSAVFWPTMLVGLRKVYNHAVAEIAAADEETD